MEPVEGLRVARTPVGDQRRLVAVGEHDPVGPEAAQKGGERAADRAAAPGDQHAPAAEPLLELEHRGDGVAAVDHRLPVEAVERHAARGTSRLGRRSGQRALDRAVRALHVDRAPRIRLVDLRDDEGQESA